MTAARLAWFGQRSSSICVARGVLMLCHVVYDHRATCDHYG
jgi:hypothetical protein